MGAAIMAAPSIGNGPVRRVDGLSRAGLAAGMTFSVEILDTWNMTVTPVEGIFKIITDATYRYHAEGLKRVKLPALPWIALRIRRIGGDVIEQKESPRIYGE